MLVWHYTWGHLWPMIQESGLIKLAKGKLDVKERAAVWFSANTEFERTALKHAMNNRGERMFVSIEQCEQFCNGLYRIGVDKDALGLVPWVEYRRVSGISRIMANELADTGRERGANPSDWFVSFAPVTRDCWITVERRVAVGVWENVL